MSSPLLGADSNEAEGNNSIGNSSNNNNNLQQVMPIELSVRVTPHTHKSNWHQVSARAVEGSFGRRLMQLRPLSLSSLQSSTKVVRSQQRQQPLLNN